MLPVSPLQELLGLGSSLAVCVMGPSGPGAAGAVQWGDTGCGVLTGVVWLVWLEERATGDTNVVNLPPSFSLNQLGLAAQDYVRRSNPSSTDFCITSAPNLITFVQCQDQLQILLEEMVQDSTELTNE